MTIRELPKLETYETGSQIRRSMKSVRANVVEGYGRRRYKQEFVKHLTYAIASCDETIDHLETLFETDSLKDDAMYQDLHERLTILDKSLIRFLSSVEKNHMSPK